MRRRIILALLTAALSLLSAAAADPVLETYDLAQLDGVTIGSVKTRVVADGKLFRATRTLELTLRRYGSAVRLSREERTTETADGQVVALAMQQGSGGAKQLQFDGTRDGDVMTVKIDGGRVERKLAWSDDVVGLYREERLFAERKPKPDDKLTLRRYDPTYNAVVTTTAHVKEREVVDLLGARRLLQRVELTPEPLVGKGVTIRPPKSVWWLDESNTPVRRQIEIDGLGTVILTRTTRDKVTSAASTSAPVDVGSRSLVALDKVIPRPFETKSVVYSVTVRDETDPTSVVCQDEHQEVKNARGETFELHVHPAKPGEKVEKTRASAEFLASCHYLDHEEAIIQTMMKRAVMAETDPWKKAVRIERWVKNAMRNDNAAPLVPASQIAQTRQGDCRHHAFLTAALCRAAGLPSRTAMGLLYVYKGGPKLGFHMWTEVYVDGQWLGLDSTLGKGGVSGAHVKVSDHSWHETASLTPLLPVNRVIGKLRVKVVRAE